MSLLGWQVRVHSSVVCQLLDRRCEPGSHGKTVPCKDAFMYLKGSHSTRLVIQGDRPESICCVRFEVEVPVMELLYLISGKQQCA